MAANDKLSLDPAGQFSDAISGWADGQTYEVNLTVKQITPGEFEVLALAESEAEPEAEAEPAEEKKPKHPNPAIAILMTPTKK